MDFAELEEKLMATANEIEELSVKLAKDNADYLEKKDLAELSFEAIKEDFRIPGEKQSEAELTRLARTHPICEKRGIYFESKAKMKALESKLDALRSISSVEKLKSQIL